MTVRGQTAAGPLGRLDNVDGGPDAAFYIQMGVIEQVSIRCRFQGCNGPVLVAFVPLRISARTAASSASSPRALASRVRRRARDLGSATTKIFTSACGQITVPMSRPSSTAPADRRRIDAENSANLPQLRKTPRRTDAASPTDLRLEAGFPNFSGIELKRR